MHRRSFVPIVQEADHGRDIHDASVNHPAASRIAHTVDRLVAGTVLLVCLPLLILRAALAKVQDGQVLQGQRRIGHQNQEIVVRSFAGNWPGRRLPYLASVVTGDLRLIGPAPRYPHSPAGQDAPCCRDVVPGLISTHRLRTRTGIAYDAEPQHIDQYLLTRRNFGLILRYCLAAILDGDRGPTPDHIVLDGVRILNTTMRETLSWCIARARERNASILCFVNADCLNQVVRHSWYREILHRADRVVADGIGIRLAAGFRGSRMRENVNGTDLFPKLCEAAADADMSLFFLGARPGIARAAAEDMMRRVPGLRVVGVEHGYCTDEEWANVVHRINGSGAQILLVGMGAPRQEEWIDRYRDELTVGLVVGVGGLFDFYSGSVPRAPQWLREIGLEWAWRLAHEPGRMWRRYLVGNPRFLARNWWAARRIGLTSEAAHSPSDHGPAAVTSRSERAVGATQPAPALRVR